jgi:hypothetical protein
VHAENVSGIRNLKTGYLSPQYHVVFDDWFETVYASDETPPPEWEDMCIMQQFETVFNEGLEPPSLAEEWLTPEEVTKNRAKGQVQSLRNGRQLYHEVCKKEHKEYGDNDPFPNVVPTQPPPQLEITSQQPVHLNPTPPSTSTKEAIPSKPG